MATRRYVAVDSETVSFSPGDMAPQLVTIQWQYLDENHTDETRHILTRSAGALAQVRRLLVDPETVLVLHNGAYDAVVWCREGLTEEVFRAYEEGRILCTMAFERLGEIAGYSTRKKLDLATCCKAHGVPPPPLKDDGLATGFGQFFAAQEIPEPHRAYALDDCVVGKLFQRQYRRFQDVKLTSLQRFSRTLFWLQLTSVWGLRTNADLVAAFKADVAAQLAALRPAAQELGYLRANGTRNMTAIREAVELAYGAATPRTPTGKAQTSGLVLAESGDPGLEAFAKYGELAKAESADVPMLERGWLHPRYGFADTGRTTCSKPNVQNFPGGGLVRQCIQPADGYCFLERDYSGVELCTFAAVAGRSVGDWSMANTINASGDPGFMHAVLGGHLLGISPQELLKRRKAGDDLAENARTRAKNANFGFIGGLGYRKYVDYVRMLSKGKIILTLEESKALRDAWAEAVPAGPAYLKFVGSTERFDGTYEAYIDGVEITRRGLWYAAAANCRFQGLAAGIMHEAGWRLAKAQYLPGGALYGVRTVSFVHDAFILEARADDSLHDVDVVFERILREAAAEVMPEVITKSEGHAAYSLAKKVDGQKVSRVEKNGQLVPWTPKAT